MVDRVATISNEQSRAVLLVETGRMTLTVRNMDAGQAVEELEVDYDGEPFEIGFNARYLLDLTGQVGGELAGVPLGRAIPAASPCLRLHPGARPH